jgi:hypothetical protein
MRVALCTTTINVPHVLKLYRACGADARFFVAGDEKTPHAEVQNFCDVLDGSYLHPYNQTHAGWKCSELIGWSSIQRRNIAFLEALKWGADAIVSIDDDNAPTSTNYFEQITGPLRTTFHFDGVGAQEKLFDGICASGKRGWFDVGQLLLPKAPHRGYPRQIKHEPVYAPVTGQRVGVAAGICLGDPDIDATTRLALAPDVHQVSLLLEAGLTVNPSTWTVFNSQNTAILREFMPAWGMWPFCGRMDDIFASLLCQRVMRERGMAVHFGRPYVWQQRNDHNLVKDLRGEIDGYENVAKLADVLDHIPLLGKSVIDDCRAIWKVLNHVDYIPGRTVAAMMAYIDDCERAMA